MNTEYFEAIEVGTEFESSGTRWVKRSSRTAAALDYSNKVFYFNAKELVVPA